MTSDSLDRTERIFSRARGLPPGSRASFLDRACGDDRQLRREVEALLTCVDEMDEDFLATPLLRLDEAPPGLAAGTRVGIYRLRNEIGRGGMGAIYLAARDDDEYQQEVAVKILKRGLDTEELVRRFRHERQILARLDHPSIATLLDGGTTDDGLPFLVMEHVEGEPIDRYCQAHRLSIRARLVLFRKVLAAVHFAHQNLVVHRDLKPGNILITPHGEPKLLDFGIAKLLAPDPAPLTTVAPPPLTPEYASPEQLREGPVTTACDVFALGILLYELLAVRHPFKQPKCSREKLRQRICEQDPEPPSRAVGHRRDRGRGGRSRARRLAGDLDSIVLMALEKEPRRRYASVEQLSDDLHRHLEGLPVRARKTTAFYRVSKLARRHRWGVSVAAAALLGILGFAISMLVLWNQATQERRRAEEVTRFLVGAFRNPDPRISLGKDVTARQLLDQGAKSIAEDLKEQPAIRASLLNAMGQAYLGLALYDDAEPVLEESLRLRRQSPQTRPEELAATLFNLVAVLRARDRHREAEALAHEAQEILRRGRADDASLAAALNNQAGLLKEQGNVRAAEDLYREALAMKIRLFGDQHERVALGMQNLAATLKDQGKNQQAEALYRRSLAIRVQRHGEPSPQVATTLNNLGLLLKDQGDLAGAEPALRNALEMRRQVYGSEHPRVASSLINLGALLELAGRYDEAEALYRRALGIFLAVSGEESLGVAIVLRHQATLALARGSPASAETAARRALEILRRIRPEGDWRLAVVESILGACLAASGRAREAEPLLTRSYFVLKDAKGDQARQTREARHRLEQLRAVRGAPVPSPPHPP